MFENFILISIVIIILWIAILAYYLLSSRQQRNLQKDIDSLNDLLDRTDKKD